MHIFNHQNKPYLLISSNELLFRQNNLDENMQRIEFSTIKKITLVHRYSPEKELFVWLSVQTNLKSVPYLIQVSLLSESLEDIFAVLEDELKSKVSLKLAKSAKITRLRNNNKNYKKLSILVALFFFSLGLYHKFVLPPVESIKVDATKFSYQKTQGLCSSNVKVAYASDVPENTLVKNYCGVLGFWQLQDSKEVPLKYLQTEFESISVTDLLSSSRKFLEEKNYEKALLSLQKAIYLEPDNETTQVYLSKMYKVNGDSKKAMVLAKKILINHPDFALAHENIALLYQDENNLEAAYKHFLNYNRLNPDSNSYVALAAIQEKQNLHNEALINYEKALVLSPKSTYILTKVGLAYWDKKEFTKAEDALEKAYEVEPSNPGYFLNFYEITLVTKSTITSEQKEQFLLKNKDTVRYMMVYDMLGIIEASIEGKEDSETKEIWKEKYQNEKLDWSFVQMRAWLDDSPLDIEHIQDIQRTLGFFIGHQQAYSMRVQNPQEQP